MELIEVIMLVFAFYGLFFIMAAAGARLSARNTQVKEGYSGGVSTPTIGIIVAVLLVALLIGLNVSGERLMARRS